MAAEILHAQARADPGAAPLGIDTVEQRIEQGAYLRHGVEVCVRACAGDGHGLLERLGVVLRLG